MASTTDIANLALTILGKDTIFLLDNTTSGGRAINAVYDSIRRGMLEGPGIWRFSVKRASLPALSTVPVSGPFTTMYQMPTDCLRTLQVGDMYAGLDLSDYRQGPTDADYSIEGRAILCDYGSPISLSYIADVTDPMLFNPNFVIAFAAQLAWTTCERQTGSDAKKEEAKNRKMEAMKNGLASSAMVNPPNYPGDDSWILARQQ